MNCTRWISIVGCAAIAAPVGSAAPQYLQTVTGAAPFDQLGSALAGVGDFNGDGFDDWVAGAPGLTQVGHGDGYARVYSGADGSVLATISGSPDSRMGFSVAGVGDWNQDGFDDVAVGAPYDKSNGFSSGLVEVISGADQSVLFAAQGTSSDRLGWSVASAGDVNGDSVVDLIVGAPYAKHGVGSEGDGSAYVYSGANGAILYTFHQGDSHGLVGWSVAGLGDLNGDNFDDVIVGEPYADRATVYSGFDGSVLRTHLGVSAAEHFGHSIAVIGNVDGDAHADYAISSPYDSSELHWQGSVRLYSGSTGAEIDTLSGNGVDQWAGWSVDGAGDLNQDGFDDFLIGVPSYGPSDAGRVRVHSGQDRSILHEVGGGSAFEEMGTAVAGVGDINGDGFPDFAVAAPKFDAGAMAQDGGRVRIWSGAFSAFFTEGFCRGLPCPCGNDGTVAGCLNSLGHGALLSSSGSTSASSDETTFYASGVMPGQSALLFVGTGNLSSGLPLGDGMLCVSGNIVRLSIQSPPFGTATWGPGLGAIGNWSAGDTRYFQVWYRDAAGGPCDSGFNLSSGVKMLFIP